jgi:hypothetical protein
MFVDSSTDNSAQPSPSQTAPLPVIAPIRNKPGKDPAKMKAAIVAIQEKFTSGEISLEQLGQMKQKSLASIYPHAGRTLLVKARIEVMRLAAYLNIDTTPG